MGFSALNRILIIQLVVMLGLSVFITITVSNKTRDNAIEHMGAIADERAHIIENYVENSENTLKNFCKAQQVQDILKYSSQLAAGTNVSADAQAAQKAAQQFTEEFGKDIDNLEGLWIGSWDTHVLTHTNAAVVGMQTRPDAEKQKELHNGMERNADKLYDLGIMISPASQKQCLSMYQAVYSAGGDPIGFVGLGIYTDGLINTLNSIPIRGVENSFYSMVDVNSGLYIFNADDTSKIHTPIENEDLKNICAQYKGTTASDSTGDYEYVKDGEKYISIYTYIPERGWLVTIDDTKGEVFALKTTMIIYLGIFGVVILGLIIVFNVISKRQEAINQKLLSTINKNTMTKKSLNTAMFKDVLTGVNNRVSFTMNLDKIKASEDSPCYFAMFNIIKFSEINSTYGAEAGDLLLVKTTEALTEFFPDCEIYRTGSDEFLAVIPAPQGNPNMNEVMDKVNLAFRQMCVSKQIENVGTIRPDYKVAVGRKTKGNADTAIIGTLKKKMNESDKATIGMIECIDL